MSRAIFIPIGPTAHAASHHRRAQGFSGQGTCANFIADLKEKGNGFKAGPMGGIGSSSHMACLLFNSAIGGQPDTGRLSRQQQTSP